MNIRTRLSRLERIEKSDPMQSLTKRLRQALEDEDDANPMTEEKLRQLEADHNPLAQRLARAYRRNDVYEKSTTTA